MEAAVHFFRHLPNEIKIGNYWDNLKKKQLKVRMKKEEKLEWEKIFERDGNAWVAMDFVRRRNEHVNEKKKKSSGGKFGVKNS